jgi:hypothetical protein
VRRWLEPSIVIFVLALVVSFALHFRAYTALGTLAELVDVGGSPPEPATVEFTIGEPDDRAADEPAASDGDEAEEEAEDDATSDAPKPEKERPEPEREREKERERAKREEREREKERQKKEEEKTEEQEAKQPQSRPPDPATRHAIRQQARNEESPDNAQFVAEHANRVQEQTVARQRNLVRDDAEPAPGEPQEPSEASEPGNANEDRIEQMEDQEGSDQRDPTPEESEQQRPDRAPDTPLPPVARGDGTREGEPGEPSRGRGGQRSGEAERSQEREGSRATDAEDMITVNDGFGELRVPRADSTQARGDGEQDRNEAAAGRRGGARARRGRRGEGLGLGGAGPNQRVAWSKLQELYGRERLAEEREAYVEERRSRRRGGNGRQKRWKKFRAAIENYVPNVKPGNQTALNAAASPFAGYISDIHRRIHPEFAGRFIANLPTYDTSPFADRSLKTKLEIILNRDGSVHRVGVVETSGFLPFDYGAFASIMRGQPYPEAPTSILSGDGRVYLHWGFYRNRRQCGTFNAEPYILPNPPGTPAPDQGGLKDEPEWGGVVPDDAAPTWGTDGQEAGDEGSGEGGSEEGSGGGDGQPSEPAEENRRKREDDPGQPSEPDEPAPRVPPGAAMG